MSSISSPPRNPTTNNQPGDVQGGFSLDRHIGFAEISRHIGKGST